MMRALRQEAIALRDAIKREIADRDMVPATGRTIADLGSAFLASRSSNRASADDRGRWATHVASSPLGKRVPSTITTKDVVGWLSALQRKRTSYDPKKHGKRTSKTLSWQTRKHALNLFRRFFVWAVEEGHAPSNPCLGLKVARQDGDETEGFQDGWYLNAEEQTSALEILKDDVERWIVAFAMGTGLRQGEQWCLHLEDVHVEGDDPHVLVRFGSWDKRTRRYRSPKGRKGEKHTRKVPLFGLALDAARAWLEALPTYAPKNPLALMFPMPGGQRRDSKPPACWTKVVTGLGIVPRIGRKPWWHLLRHTCASSLISGWWGTRWRLEDVRAVLGHTDIKTTQRYAHLGEGVVQGVASEAQAAWVSRHEPVTAFKESVEIANDPASAPQRIRTSDLRLRRP
jgi:integrase